MLFICRSEIYPFVPYTLSKLKENKHIVVERKLGDTIQCVLNLNETQTKGNKVRVVLGQ